MSLKFVQPDSLPAAVELLAQHGEEAKIIAGGTAIVLMMRQKLIAPQVLISLGGLSDLIYIRSDASGMRLGSMTSLRDLARSPLVQKQCPALAYACGEVGNVRVQNQATIGGNLAEADYASDPPAMLLALDASVTVRGPDGDRVIPLSGFFHGFYTTDLQPDELVTEITVPTPPAGTRMAYHKFKSRSSEDRPCAGIAVVAAFAQGVCTHLRVAVGAACEVPTRLPEVEAMAQGAPWRAELVAEIAAGYAANLETLDDLRGSSWYRTQIVRTLIQRALKEVADGSG